MANNLESNPLEGYLGERRFHENWSSFLILGIILVLLGILAIVCANYVTLTSIIFFGVMLAIGGILQVLYAFWVRKGRGFSHTLVSGLLYMIVGLVFITHPTATALAVTLLLSAFYSVTGLFKIIVSLTTPLIQWGWLLFSGMVSLALGMLIWAEWPTTGLWFIGLLIGIDLIFVGWFWIMLSLTARNLPMRP